MARRVEVCRACREPRGSTAFPEILLAAVPKPDTKRLRDLFALFLAQRLVHCDRLGALTAAGSIAMRIPQRTRKANPPANFLDQRLAGERLLVLFLHQRLLPLRRCSICL